MIWIDAVGSHGQSGTGGAGAPTEGEGRVKSSFGRGIYIKCIDHISLACISILKCIEVSNTAATFAAVKLGYFSKYAIFRFPRLYEYLPSQASVKDFYRLYKHFKVPIKRNSVKYFLDCIGKITEIHNIYNNTIQLCSETALVCAEAVINY